MTIAVARGGARWGTDDRPGTEQEEAGDGTEGRGHLPLKIRPHSSAKRSREKNTRRRSRFASPRLLHLGAAPLPFVSATGGAASPTTVPGGSSTAAAFKEGKRRLGSGARVRERLRGWAGNWDLGERLVAACGNGPSDGRLKPRCIAFGGVACRVVVVPYAVLSSNDGGSRLGMGFRLGIPLDHSYA
ncbi:hypothetical protein EJB05_51702, partial [Eragrostis curvula]